MAPRFSIFSLMDGLMTLKPSLGKAVANQEFIRDRCRLKRELRENHNLRLSWPRQVANVFIKKEGS
jgi:hypothetical protein